MKRPYVFDLEVAIRSWRRGLASTGDYLEDDLDELERHVRDHVAAAGKSGGSGDSAQSAFREAVRSLAPGREMTRDYRKVFWGQAARRGRLQTEIGRRLSLVGSYVRIAWRHARRDWGYTILNTVGLAAGLTVFLLVALFLRHEWTYDRFHRDADRIFRLEPNGERIMTAGPLGPALKAEFPAVEQFVRVKRVQEALVSHGETRSYESRVLLVDSTFFDVFSFGMRLGDPVRALARPMTVVLAESVARRFFGDQDPIGRTLHIRMPRAAGDYEVTGVVRDAPANSHLKFDFLVSLGSLSSAPARAELDSWLVPGVLTYIRLRERDDAAGLAVSMGAFQARHFAAPSPASGGIAAPQGPGVPHLRKIADIHMTRHVELDFEPPGDPGTAAIFSIVAILTLLIAVINYVNLATARSIDRVRELALRKVLGADRRQLVSQHLGESLLLVVLAALVAASMTTIALPWFESVVGTELRRDAGSWGSWGAIAVAGILGLGVLSGLYPAFVLSRTSSAHPSSRLKGRLGPGIQLRRILVVFQFAASVVLVSGTIVMGRQLDFLQAGRLGLSPEQVLTIDTHFALEPTSFEALRNELESLAGVLSVSWASPSPPIRSEDLGQIQIREPEPGETVPGVHALFAGPGFLETLQIPLVAGRAFDETDWNRGDHLPTIVNEAAVRLLGWEDPVGRIFENGFDPLPIVVGVIPDVHFQSLKDEIVPLAILATGAPGDVLVRLRPESVRQTVADVSATWTRVAPGIPFHYSFMDDGFEAEYDAEQRLARAFGAFSLLAVLVAGLGLFGLASFVTKRRTREIGIRRVLGAGVAGLVTMLSADYLRLVAVALVLGCPVAFLLIRQWLAQYPYRIEAGAGVWIWTALAVALLAVVSVAQQAVRAAFADPATSVRHE